jgi:hypothetical protein
LNFKLAKKIHDDRKILEDIYARHNIKVIKWHRALLADTESTIPRSYFDFIADLDKAQQEFMKNYEGEI